MEKEIKIILEVPDSIKEPEHKLTDYLVNKFNIDINEHFHSNYGYIEPLRIKNYKM